MLGFGGSEFGGSEALSISSSLEVLDEDPDEELESELNARALRSAAEGPTWKSTLWGLSNGACFFSDSS